MLQKLLSLFKSKEIAQQQAIIENLYKDLSKKQDSIDRIIAESREQDVAIANLVARKTPPTNNTVLLYTDKSGTNWFGFKTFEYLPNARRVQYLLCTTAIELNLTKTEMSKYLDTMNSLLFNIEKDLLANKSKLISLK